MEAAEAMNGPGVTWWGENQDEQRPERQMNSSKQAGNCRRKAGCPVSELLPGTPRAAQSGSQCEISLAKEATCLCIKADEPALSGSGRFPGCSCWLKPESGVKAISWQTFLMSWSSCINNRKEWHVCPSQHSK